MLRAAASLSAIAALVILATGCIGAVNEKNWGDKSARISCKLAKRCSTSQFYYHYDDLSECIDEAMETYSEEQDDLEASCSFDKERARECVRAMKSSCKDIGLDYEQLYEACFEVWSCDGGDLPFDDTGGTTDPTAPTLEL